MGARDGVELQLQLAVDGLQLLVDRLQLLLAGLELLRGRAVLLVDRLELFVGGAQLLGGALRFLARGVQVLLRQLELRPQPAHDLVARRTAIGRGQRGVDRLAFEEQDHGALGLGILVAVDRRDAEMDPVRRAVEAHQHRPAQRRLALLEGAVQRRAQLEPQLASHEVHRIVAQRAARGLQIAPGIVGQVDHPVVAVHQHAGRRDLLDRGAMKRGLVEHGARAERRRRRLADAEASEQPWKQARLVAGVGRRLIDPGVPVGDVEQVGRMVGGLGRTEEEEAARLQGIVKGAAGLLLHVAIEIDQQIAA